jgi:DNA-binding beta-propeller fold protein YncE
MVAAHSSGVVYITDNTVDRVQKFDTQGAFLGKWGSTGDAEGEFRGAWGVAVDSGGNVYISDNTNQRVQKFDSSGSFLRTWGFGVDDGTNVFQICTSGCQAGIAGFGSGQLSSPDGVAVDAANNVYVANYASTRVVKYDSNGNYLTQWGAAGNSEGQFSSGPVGIAVDEDGFIYTTEESNYRVQVFDPAGTFVRMWGYGVQDGSNELQVCTSSCQGGISGTGEGQLSDPEGVAVDARGDVYVVDSLPGNRVQKFDRYGTFLCQWNSGNGLFNAPYGAAIQGSSFYLTDSSHGRIVKFGGPYLETFVGEPEQE